MNIHTSKKYIFSSQRRGGHDGLFIAIPNQTYSDSVALRLLQPLSFLFNRSCHGQA